MSFSVIVTEDNLKNITNTLSLMNISKKSVKTKKNNEILKGPLDKFIVIEKSKEDSLTLSDFDCDYVDLDLSDIVNRIIT